MLPAYGSIPFGPMAEEADESRRLDPRERRDPADAERAARERRFLLTPIHPGLQLPAYSATGALVPFTVTQKCLAGGGDNNLIPLTRRAGGHRRSRLRLLNLYPHCCYRTTERTEILSVSHSTPILSLVVQIFQNVSAPRASRFHGHGVTCSRNDRHARTKLVRQCLDLLGRRHAIELTNAQMKMFQFQIRDGAVAAIGRRL